MQVIIVAALWMASCAFGATPNVLFLVADDLRPEIGAFGSKIAITPNLDALAEDSVIFSQASVQQAVCNPSRSSFLTGRRVDSLRVWDLQACWRTAGGVNATSMPQYFKQHGYTTGGSGKLFHPVWNNHTKTTDDVPYSWSLPYYHPPSSADKHYANLSHTFWPVPGHVEHEMPDWMIANNGVEMLKNVSSRASKPWFVGVGLHRPHLPWVAPDEYWDLYPLSTVQLPDWPYRPHEYGAAVEYGWDPQSGPRHCDDIQALNVSFPDGYIPEAHGRLMKQGYLAATSYTDSNLGQVLQQLKQTGQYDNTVIVFVGDHGWQLGEHGEWGKKTTWQTSVVAPLMIKPASPASKPSSVSFDPGFASTGSALRRRLGVDPSRAIPGETAQAAEARRSRTVPPALAAYQSELRSSLVASDALVEFASIYPTIADLVGLPVPPTCPPGPAGLKNTTCVEGQSFAGAVKLALEGKPVRAGQTIGGTPAAAFSQYPHCMHDIDKADFWGCHDPSLAGKQPRFMGYTILAIEQGSPFRYTAWVNFSVTDAKPQWDEILAEELYAREADAAEDYNVAADPVHAEVKHSLYTRLVAGWRAAMIAPYELRSKT